MDKPKNDTDFLGLLTVHISYLIYLKRKWISERFRLPFMMTVLILYVRPVLCGFCPVFYLFDPV